MQEEETAPPPVTSPGVDVWLTRGGKVVEFPGRRYRDVGFATATRSLAAGWVEAPAVGIDPRKVTAIVATRVEIKRVWRALCRCISMRILRIQDVILC
jgi:hypothetical protein